MDRIKLTEPILVWELCEVLPQYEEPQFVSYFLRKEDLDNYIKGTKKIWQYGCDKLDKSTTRQILDDQEKAEKYDACKNLINQVNELLQENKQLKEEVSDLMKEHVDNLQIRMNEAESVLDIKKKGR